MKYLQYNAQDIKDEITHTHTPTHILVCAHTHTHIVVCVHNTHKHIKLP